MKPKRSRGTLGRLVTLGVLAVIGLLWIRLLVVQPRAEEPVELADTKQTRQAHRKLTELTGAVNQMEAASRRGETRRTIVRLSASDINALLAAEPEVRTALENSRVRDPQVRLQPGRVLTTATVEAAGVPVTVQAQGQLGAREGMLIYAPESVRIGRLLAPGPIRNAVDSRIQQAFERFEEKSHARVDRVIVGRDAITLHLSSEPE